MLIYQFIDSMLRTALKGRDEERGATATEYALLVAFIAFAIILGVTAFATQLSTFFQNLSTTVSKWKSS